MKKLEDIELFRMTHIENIPHILKYGITHKKSVNSNSEYKDIGDSMIISERDKKEVEVTNGTNKLVKKIILGDYIPFNFGVKMPMLYVIQDRENFYQCYEPISSENIVYIVCMLIKVIELDNEFYFSNGHAFDYLTIFYDKSRIQDIVNIINWRAVNSNYWGGYRNLELKREKQAEFLVKEYIPFSVVKKFICYNREAKNKLLNYGVNSSIIEINRYAYY